MLGVKSLRESKTSCVLVTVLLYTIKMSSMYRKYPKIILSTGIS
jgi:hypothetical protein